MQVHRGIAFNFLQYSNHIIGLRTGPGKLPISRRLTCAALIVGDHIEPMRNEIRNEITHLARLVVSAVNQDDRRMLSLSGRLPQRYAQMLGPVLNNEWL